MRKSTIWEEEKRKSIEFTWS